VFRQMTGRQQKLLAVSILLMLIIVVVAAVGIPIWSVNKNYSDKIDQMSTRLAILKRNSAERELLIPEYNRLKNFRLSDKRYLQSKSEALAAAEIQRVIKAIIVPNAGEILSTQIISNNKKEKIPQITLKVRMRGNINTLVKVFYKIETGDPFLTIDNLTLRSRNVRQRRSIRNNNQIPQVSNDLDVQFEISGYIRGGDA
jgi:general secretion pathway protein M